MNVFVYDSFLNHKKYNSVLAKIETRITDLGLNGKISRLGIIRNVKEAIENEIRRGAKVIIAVGNDDTVSEVINSMAMKNVPLALIPIDSGTNIIAKNLGIGLEEKACDVLAARRVEKVDLGTINGYYFLMQASITNNSTIIEIDKNYSIETLEEGDISVINMPTDTTSLPDTAKFNPQDGVLELFIKTKKATKVLRRKKEVGKSIFSLKNLTLINSKEIPVIIDGVKKINTPAEIGIAPGALNIIVGKDRIF